MDQTRSRARLQTMHSCPTNQKWNTPCSSCQKVHTSMSCGNFSPPQAQATLADPPKINVIPVTSLPRSLSTGASTRSTKSKHPPAAAKVEAEAEHLREIEGQDYHMMEGIIRRRLHRDSEDLDNSLEVTHHHHLIFCLLFVFRINFIHCCFVCFKDLCNAPIPGTEEALDSFDESSAIKPDGAVNFSVGDTLLEVSEMEEKRPRTVSFTSAKVGAELLLDVPKRVHRPVKPAISNETVDELSDVLPLPSTIATTPPCHGKSDEDVTIVVEDDIF